MHGMMAYMNNQEQILKMVRWVSILLVIFLAVISIRQIKGIWNDNTFPSVISVTGKGEAISIPDIATFSFSVNENGKTVKEAQDKATEKINGALASVKAGGVAEKDIKTLSYSINPHYDYVQGVCNGYVCPPGKSVLNGYDVSQTIEVKIRDLSKAGDLFDTIGKAGIQTVNGLSFSIDNIDSVKAAARADAIEKAKAQAKKIAKDLGVRLVKITGYDEPGSIQYPVAFGGETMSLDAVRVKTAATPQVPTGEQKVTSNVTITYEIR